MTHTRLQVASLDGLARLDDGLCAELRGRLAEVGFTAPLVAEAEAFFPGVLRGPRLPVIRWWLEQRPEPGAALARLFLFDDTLAADRARDALTPTLFSALVDAGVLANVAGQVDAAFVLHPWCDGLLVLADRLGSGADAVMGPGGGTDHLAGLVPDRRVPSALDLGCGAGSFALLAARRGAARSVGVDVNPRAIEIARFNARLNALDVELLVGDATAPVADQTFDLVLSQPPFVARPPGQDPHTFLFGGDRGDELPLRFIAAASRVLAPGGRAMLLLQAPEPREADGATLMDGIRRALDDTRAHVLSIVGKGPSPATQAAVFASFEDPQLGDTYAAAARRYLDHFQALGVGAVTGALVVLSRPTPDDDSGRRYALALAVASAYYDAGTLDQFLRGMDLAEGPDEVVARARLRLSSRARVARGRTDAANPADGRVNIRIAPPGIGTDLSAGPDELRVLEAIDGAASVGAAIDALVRSARAPLLAFVRQALVHGTLVRL